MNEKISEISRFRQHISPMMNTFDEQQALEGLKLLDAASISAIYNRYYVEVYKYAMYRLNDTQAAEDLASEVFVRLLDAVEKKQGPHSNLRGWLIGTASHMVLDEYRRRYRKPEAEIPDSLADQTPGPEHEAVVREGNQAVREVYSQLTEEQQQVLSLRFGQGYSLEETAALMKKNVNAVKALQFRALASLQRGMSEVYDE